MKVSVELQDEQFKYEFEVGQEKGNGEHALSVHAMDLFISIVNECHKSWMSNNKEEMNEIFYFAFLEKHPEVVKKYIEFEKKRGHKF